MFRNLISVVTFAAGLSFATSASAATQLISNGDFEGGNLAGWTCNVSGDSSCKADTGGLSPSSGSWYMELWENIGVGSVSQSIATVAGTKYNFSFFSMTNSPSEIANVLGYSLDGGAITDVARTGSPTQWTDMFIASGASADITFYFETNPGSGAWAVDDVSVMSAIPLPATLPLLLSAFVGLYWRSRRRS